MTLARAFKNIALFLIGVAHAWYKSPTNHKAIRAACINGASEMKCKGENHTNDDDEIQFVMKDLLLDVMLGVHAHVFRQNATSPEGTAEMREMHTFITRNMKVQRCVARRSAMERRHTERRPKGLSIRPSRVDGVHKRPRPTHLSRCDNSSATVQLKLMATPPKHCRISSWTPAYNFQFVGHIWCDDIWAISQPSVNRLDLGCGLI